MVAERPARVEAGREALAPVVCGGARGGRGDALGRARLDRRHQCESFTDRRGAGACGRSCALLLFWQARLAGESEFLIRTLEHERRQPGAVLVPPAGARLRLVLCVARAKLPCTSRGAVVFFRHSAAGTWIRERRMVCLLVCRGSFPIPREPWRIH